MEEGLQSSTGASEYFWNQLPIEQSPDDENNRKDTMIFLRTEWKVNIIQFRLFLIQDLNRAWEANINIKELHKRAEEFEIPVLEFMQETKESLTKLDGLNNFKYYCDWADDKESCRFTWKKCSGLTLIYGQVDLKLALPTNTLNIIKEFATLKENESKLRNAYVKLQDCYKSACGSIKDQHRDLLSKCILLVNSKKAKIRELEDKLSKFEAEGKKQPPVAAITEDSEDSPLSNLRTKKPARSLNRIFSQSSSQDDSEPLPLSSLPKRSKRISEREAEIVIEDESEEASHSQATVLDSQLAPDDEIFDEL